MQYAVHVAQILSSASGIGWPLSRILGMGRHSKESADRADLGKGYAALVTATDPQAAASDFRWPFVGHLPGYLATSEAAGADPADEKAHFELLIRQ
jgi:hypothetical protein